VPQELISQAANTKTGHRMNQSLLIVLAIEKSF